MIFICILDITTHHIEQGQETKLDISFEAFPHVSKNAVRWNILHTNFKGSNWKYNRAKESDVRKKDLSYDEMVNNEVFRISNDMSMNDNTHSMELFVSSGYQYDEYSAVGDEFWLVEMVVKVKVASTESQY